MNDETAGVHDDGGEWLLSDDEFDALEAVLTSDDVPEDCMDLEMLDGYFAAVIVSPVVIPVAAWMPGIWSAHGDEVSFTSGSVAQQALRLVRAYYNELVVSIARPDGWEPFCYAAAEIDELSVGEEWIEGFMQGLELWPDDWPQQVPQRDAEAIGALLEDMVAPWEDAAAADVDDETRLEWLASARGTVAEIFTRWRALGLPAPEPLEMTPEVSGVSGSGRNDPCPCGSGKKYKKCCGAE